MNNEQAKHKQEILAALFASKEIFATQQMNIQKAILIPAALYTFKYKSLDVVDRILNEYNSLSGTVRVEAIAYWFKHVAGFNSEYSSKLKAYVTTLAKRSKGEPAYTSEVMVNGKPILFTYDKAHLDICKRQELYYWNIAPVVIKELKVRSDLPKITQGIEVELARALATASLTPEAIAAHFATIVQRIEQLSKSNKTAVWVAEFNSQHADKEDKEETAYPEITEVEQHLIEESLSFDEVEP